MCTWNWSLIDQMLCHCILLCTVDICAQSCLGSSNALTRVSSRYAHNLSKLGRYHDIIEYRDINLETISISDGFGLNRNIDISRYLAIITIIAIYRNID